LPGVNPEEITMDVAFALIAVVITLAALQVGEAGMQSRR
jgi:hypothetical protein